MLKIRYDFNNVVKTEMCFRIREHSTTVEITLCFTSKPSCEHCITLHCSILHRSIEQMYIRKRFQNLYILNDLHPGVKNL